MSADQPCNEDSTMLAYPPEGVPGLDTASLNCRDGPPDQYKRAFSRSNSVSKPQAVFCMTEPYAIHQVTSQLFGQDDVEIGVKKPISAERVLTYAKSAGPAQMTASEPMMGQTSV